MFMLSLAVVCLAGCGEEEYTYTDEGGGGGGSGGVTGILLNLQRPAGEDAAKISATAQWQVLAPTGEVFFTKGNCPKGVMGPTVAFKRADALSDSNRLAKLGENFVELRISKATFDETAKIASYHLDEASMADASSAGDIMSLLRNGKMVMLFGRDGQ